MINLLNGGLQLSSSKKVHGVKGHSYHSPGGIPPTSLMTGSWNLSDSRAPYEIAVVKITLGGGQIAFITYVYLLLLDMLSQIQQ